MAERYVTGSTGIVITVPESDELVRAVRERPLAIAFTQPAHFSGAIEPASKVGAEARVMVPE